MWARSVIRTLPKVATRHPFTPITPRCCFISTSSRLLVAVTSTSAPETSAVGVKEPSTKPPRKSSSAGSGQGGAKEKAAAKKAKEAVKKQKEKEKKTREKSRELKLKEKEKTAKLKEKIQAQKAKDKVKAEKAKEKAIKAREKKVSDKVKTSKTAMTSKLHPPKSPANTWSIFLADFVAEKKRELATGEKLPSVTVLTKEAAPLYKNLSANEKADLQHRFEEQRAAYPAILAEWKKTLTPEMIKQENLIRYRRRKAGLSHKRALKIEGGPKKPLTGFFQFRKDIFDNEGVDGRVLNGEHSVTQQSKLLAGAWKNLTEDERQNYRDTADKAIKEWQQEHAEYLKSLEEK